VQGACCSAARRRPPQGKLKPFLEQRPQLCSLSDDGRQHVVLTPAGTILGGGTPSPLKPAPTAPLSHKAFTGSAPLRGLAEGALPGGGGSSGAAAPTDQVAAAVMPGVAAAQSAAKDYKK
jgi:hypothetical protein